RGLKYAPSDATLCAKLAWVLATCSDDALRDGARAVKLAESAVAQYAGQSRESPAGRTARESLAAALAETGDFQEAVKVVSELMAQELPPLVRPKHQRLQLQLEAYRQRRPFRD
ncbi:MAG: hypothetical protein ACE5HE_12045, partial [Phycisphaerae bacterium]